MTQNERILDYMEQHGSISTMEAFRELGITRLASRMYEISKGKSIRRVYGPAKNREGETVYITRYYKDDMNTDT